MNKIREKKIIYIICLALMLAGIFFITDFRKSIFFGNNTVLKIGVFSDSYWSTANGYSHRIINDAIRKYEEENPNIQVVYESGILKEDYSEWLAEQIMKGDAPDVFFLLPEDMNTMVGAGALEDLMTYIRSDDGFDPGNFYDAAYQYGSVGSRQYSLPFECAPELMFVNRSLLDREGVRRPDSDWKWDDFYRICSEVTKDTDHNGTTDQFGVADYRWEEAFSSNDVELFNETGTECYFTDEKVTEALTFLDSLEGYNVRNSGSSDYFEHGSVAFQPMYYSKYRAYMTNPVHASRYADFQWDFLTMPAGYEGDNSSRLDTLSVAMYSGSGMKDKAWEFIKLLTCDEEIQSEIFTYSEGISPCKSVTESVLKKNHHRSYDTLVYAMSHAVSEHRFYDYNEAINAVDTSVEEILDGNGNLRMEQIIQSRNLNTFLKTLHNQ